MAKVNKRHLLSRAFSHSDPPTATATQVARAADDTNNVNNEVTTITKRYLVYMELPKIKIGDYHKSSCVVGNILRFHFLIKICQREGDTLTLQPIKVYKVPVVNVAVIHRPFIEDEMAKGPIPKSPEVKSPLIKYSTDDRDDPDANLEDDFGKGSASDAANGKRQGGKKRKKYFVYCELPKVAIGDYRISSVTSSELIHCHFLIKIAKDERTGQPVLRPIKKYRRPRVNFAVIHRSLIVDDEAMGPIPRSPGVKSPMIREGIDGDDDVEVLHATMGFNYGAAPRSKYELMSQWSLVADKSGRMVPELVLSKVD